MNKIIILLFFFFNCLYSNPIILQNSNNEINLLPYSKIHTDETSSLTFEQIRQSAFKNFTKKSINEGFSKHTTWFYFQLTNSSDSPVHKTLYFDHPLSNALTLYYKNNQQFKKRVFKEYHTFQNSLNVNFNLTIPAHSTQDYYVKFQSDISALKFNMFLLNEASIYKRELPQQLLLALFFGSIITFIFYNLFIYFFTQQKAYLYYVGYFTTLIVYYSYYTNMYYYIYYYYLEYIGIYLLGLMVIFILLFTRSFLKLHQYKKINLSFNLLIALIFIITLLTNENFYPITLVICILLSVLLYVIILTYYLYFKGNKEVKYIVLGWSLAMIGYTMLALSNLGLPSFINIFPYFYECTIFLEALLFSMALSNRLNKTVALENALKQNILLTKELHHRIKNNMQFIISMYRLKLAPFINKNLEMKLKETENTIQAMSKTHEMLYSQNSLEDIDAQKYFDELISEVKQSFDFTGISIHSKIEVTLNINQSIYCGIILNELLTNSVKHAFMNKGKIFVYLKKEKGKRVFQIKDTGKGFDQTQNQGFGLMLIKSLVENDLKGKIQIISSPHTDIQIIF